MNSKCSVTPPELLYPLYNLRIGSKSLDQIFRYQSFLQLYWHTSYTKSYNIHIFSKLMAYQRHFIYLILPKHPYLQTFYYNFLNPTMEMMYTGINCRFCVVYQHTPKPEFRSIVLVDRGRSFVIQTNLSCSSWRKMRSSKRIY